MINKDFLSSGAEDEKSTNNRYIIQPQAKVKARFNTKVLTCLIASLSSFANLVLMFIYVVSPKINITTITLINIGLMIIVILCFVINRYTQRPALPAAHPNCHVPANVDRFNPRDRRPPINKDTSSVFLSQHFSPEFSL